MSNSYDWKTELHPDKPLFHQMKSPLRLFLLSLFMGEPDRVFDAATLSQEASAVLNDVEACLKPMVGQKILEELKIPSGEGYRLTSGGADGLKEAIQLVLEDSRIQIDRYRKARGLFYGLIGNDEKMKIAFEMIRTAARSETPVLISGEFGTGKRLVAKAIQRLSRRCGKHFNIFDCDENGKENFESALLGRKRQSPDESPQAGMLADTNGGTMLFFEIERLSMNNQHKLLKILKTNRFAPIGGDGLVIPLDVHLLFSAAKPLSELVERGLFLEELYHRLNLLNIRLPSLRERREDIPLMAAELLEHYCQKKHGDSKAKKFLPETLKKLKEYSWPKNAKQLKWVVEKAADFPEDSIGPDDIEELPKPIKVDSQLQNGNVSIKLVEKHHIENILNLYHWNIKRSSEQLGITRATLYKKINEYRIERPGK